MEKNFETDVTDVQRIPFVPAILEVICQATGMGFAAVARVTDDRWIACSVHDKIDFGMVPGGELKIETTICHEIRQSREPVIINHVFEDEEYREHPTPARYEFQSYISMPIILSDGTFFGTLCAIDPKPAQLKSPAMIGMFKLFADLIALHLDAQTRMAGSEAYAMLAALDAISLNAGILDKATLDDEGRQAVAAIKDAVAQMTKMLDGA